MLKIKEIIFSIGLTLCSNNVISNGFNESTINTVNLTQENISNILNLSNSLYNKDILLFISLLYILYLKRKDRKNNSSLNELFDNIKMPISKYLDNGYPEIWNKTFEIETGYSRKEIIEYWKINGEVMSLLYKGENLKKVLEYLEIIKNTGHGYDNITFTLTTKKGEEKTFIWTTTPLKDGGTIRMGRKLIDKEEINIELEKTLFKILEESKKDNLTLAFNKKALELDFLEMLKLHKDEDFIMCIIDIDNFKTINDINGHNFGDHILKEFVNFLINNIRQEDKIYRIGGDEFILLIKSNNEEIMVNKINNIRNKFFNTNFLNNFGQNINIGTSWGIKKVNSLLLHNSFIDNGGKLEINDTNLFLNKIKNEIDFYMYGVKYFKLIKDLLLKDGRIDINFNEKNAIADPILNDEGLLKGIKIINNEGNFIISSEELNLINEIKRKIKDFR